MSNSNNTLKLVNSVLSLLNVAVLHYENENQYSSLSEVQPWLMKHLVLSDNDEDLYQIAPDSPVLESFLDDISTNWDSADDSIQSSGVWNEDNTAEGEEFYKALAIANNEGRFLVVLKLGKDFLAIREKMQHAREGMLSSEILEREVRKRTQDIRIREEEVVMRLLAASGARDDETGAHVRRIGLYSELMAKYRDWDLHDRDDIRLAATMHDIGKIGIPDSVFLKPGKLNDEEWKVMKTHAAIGAEMLHESEIPLLRMAETIARYHHERYDGSGYPEGLKGDEIPEAARITAIADVYDALIHKRVYKDAIAEEVAVGMMEAESGKHFDPEILQILIDHLDEVREIRLNNQDG